MPHIQTRFIVHRFGHTLFMPVPRDVGFHTIETGFFELAKTACPQRLRHTVVMECTAINKNIFSFYLDTAVIIPNSVGIQEYRIVYRRQVVLLIAINISRIVIHNSLVCNILGKHEHGNNSQQNHYIFFHNS